MTYLSRSDGDKMLSDMAEGSADDYGDHDGQFYDEDGDESGSGDDEYRKLIDSISCNQGIDDNRFFFTNR